MGRAAPLNDGAGALAVLFGLEAADESLKNHSQLTAVRPALDVDVRLSV
jgi:hypothetical protein